MHINLDKCIGCKSCLAVCPLGALEFDESVGKTRVIQDKCVECGVCIRMKVCPVNAIEEKPLSWPRTIRLHFSNPLAEHTETRIPGRGTEEMKTNDVTDRFKFGEVGFAIDVGRPHTGTTFRDIEVITRSVAEVGVKFEEENPLTYLMTDKEKGIFPAEIHDERILSAVLEFRTNIENVASVLRALRKAADIIDTVFSVGLICRVEESGEIPLIGIVEKSGFKVWPNAKINVGLGRK